tara:strand:- start:3008 stop:3835 length:828 start_codon:yes stop_codon:yes gene_type:complete
LKNIDKKVINDFGKEWKAFNQSDLDLKELNELFNNYFNIFPFNQIGKKSIGFDMGCGSGRWSKIIAPKVKKLNCLDPSYYALEEAKKNLKKFNNCKFFNSDVMSNELENNSQDFGYCLGVLHHISDTKGGLKNCTNKLKKGAPFLLYLYYNFDNKPFWFKAIWKISDLFRKIISKLPFKLKILITTIIAMCIYWPLARLSYIIEKLGYDVSNMPLSSYKKVSFYTMKTDALDRFGTKLEKRFTKIQIVEMMKESGLINIKFNNKSPFWVAVGEKN